MTPFLGISRGDRPATIAECWHYYTDLSNVWMDINQLKLIGKEKDHIDPAFTTIFIIHTIDFAEDFLFTISSSC